MGDTMTNYEYYKMQIEKCEDQAKKASDGNLKTFYTHAAEGYKKHLAELTLDKAEEQTKWV